MGAPQGGVGIDESIDAAGAEANRIAMLEKLAVADALIVDESTAGRFEIAHEVATAPAVDDSVAARDARVGDLQSACTGAANDRVFTIEYQEASAARRSIECEQTGRLRTLQHLPTARCHGAGDARRGSVDEEGGGSICIQNTNALLFPGTIVEWSVQ